MTIGASGALYLIPLISSALIALCVLLGWIAYLRFCRFVVEKTGSTVGLRDVAVAARAGLGWWHRRSRVVPTAKSGSARRVRDGSAPGKT